MLKLENHYPRDLGKAGEGLFSRDVGIGKKRLSTGQRQEMKTR